MKKQEKFCDNSRKWEVIQLKHNFLTIYTFLIRAYSYSIPTALKIEECIPGISLLLDQKMFVKKWRKRVPYVWALLLFIYPGIAAGERR